MAPVLPDLCELDSDDDRGGADGRESDESDDDDTGEEDYFVFHNPLSLLAVVPDVVDFER
jgi:hypothetical protein